MEANRCQHTHTVSVNGSGCVPVSVCGGRLWCVVACGCRLIGCEISLRFQQADPEVSGSAHAACVHPRRALAAVNTSHSAHTALTLRAAKVTPLFSECSACSAQQEVLLYTVGILY